MSERAKWKRVDGIEWEHRRLRIGPIEAVAVGACPAWESGWSIGLAGDDPATFEAATVDEAQSKAEQALREMRDALVAHFAPVLRWEDNRAELLGCWELSVGEQPDGLWWWTTMLGGSFGEDDGDCATADDARRAAEAALRALGVAFRVEGES